MTTMNVDKLLVAAGAYFGGDGINYDRFEPHKFAALVLASTPPQPEQEPVAEVVGVSMLGVNSPTGKHINALVDLPIGAKLYTTPPQRTWVGLTDDEVAHLVRNYKDVPATLVVETEAKLKEKNT